MEEQRLRLLVYPRVRLEGGEIIHEAGPDPPRSRWVTPKLLKEMRRVRSPDMALWLCRRYGPFFPEEEKPERIRYEAREPVDAILEWCAWIPAVVTLGQALSAGRRADGPVLRALHLSGASAWELAHDVSYRLNDLLRLAHVHPHIQFDPKTERWILGASTFPLFPAVTSILGAAAFFAVERIAHPDEGLHLAVCSLCGRPYEPSRKPAEGRAHYCDECRGSSEMWRVIKRRQRARG